MANKCIRILNKGIYSGDIVFENFFCAATVETPASYFDNGFNTVGIIVRDTNGAIVSENDHAAQAGSVSWSFVTDSTVRNSQYSYGDCNACNAVFYDCINGACIDSSTHGTTGLYTSLSDCETNCGSKSCSGTCVSNSEWAQIEGLSNQLKNRNCG